MARRLFLWVISLGLLLWIWFQIPSWNEVYQLLIALSLPGLLAVAALDLVFVLTAGSRWWFVLGGLDQQVGHLKITAYRLAAMGVSYFTPGPQFGGEPLQVWLLTRRHHLSTGRALASVTIDKLLELLVNFSILLGGVVLVVNFAVLPAVSSAWALAASAGLWVLPIWLLWLLARGSTPLSTVTKWFMSGRMGVWLRRRHPQRADTLEKTVLEAEKDVHLLCSAAPGALLLAFVVTVFNWLVWLVEFWLVYWLLGLPLTFIELMILVTAARIAFLLPLPGGLGTLEASQLLAITAVEAPAAVGIGATLIFRLRDLIIAGFGLWLSGWLVNRLTGPGALESR